MKKYLFTLILIVFGFSSSAQSIIYGVIKNNKGGFLSGVNISIVDSYDGGTTDNKGYYSFSTNLKGDVIVSFSMLGYNTYDEFVNIHNDSLNINIILDESYQQLDAVIVTAGSFEAGDKKRAVTVLSSLDILTTGGANADIATSLKTLPGTQQLGDQEGLAVRGGSTHETKQYIDGSLVSKPYYTGPPNFAQRGRFSPTLFKGTVFSTGGYSALYGQALSSALILESIDLPDVSEISVDLSYIYTSLGVQQLFAKNKASWGVRASCLHIKPYYDIVKQNIDYHTVPSTYGAEANFRAKTKTGGILKYFTSFSKDKSGANFPNLDSATLINNMDINNINLYNNLSIREYLNNSWKINLGLSYSFNRDEFNQVVENKEGIIAQKLPKYIDSVYNFNAKTDQHFVQFKSVLEKSFSRNAILRFGAEYWYETSKNRYNNYNINLNDNFLSVFGEGDTYLTKKLAFKAGVRLEYSSIINRLNIAPRISFAYKTGTSSQVSAAYGIFYQKPDNKILLSTTELSYQKSTHYIVGYNYNVLGKTMRIETFYKTYNNLVKTTPSFSNAGNGYAYGVELYWRDKLTLKHFDYWISYSYLDTKRNYLNYPEKLQPNFSADHTATIVAKRFFTKIQTGFNVTYSFASGRPYYHMQKNLNDNNYTITDRGKTINYSNLGLSANYLTNWLGAYVIIVASVTNLLGQNQVFGYNYSFDGKVKSPIIPSANRFYFLGIFFSWGIDRRQDIIDGRY